MKVGWPERTQEECSSLNVLKNEIICFTKRERLACTFQLQQHSMLLFRSGYF